MNALGLLNAVAEAIYLLSFALVLRRAIRRPTPSHADMALFFGSLAVVIVASRVAPVVGTPEWIVVAEVATVMVLPYALLRLVGSFSTVRPALMRTTEAVLAASVIAAVLSRGTPPGAVVLAMVGYFCAVFLYCALRFIREARAAHGVTQRRLQSVSLGSALIGATLLAAGVEPFLSGVPAAIVDAITQTFALCSGVAYYVGFVPPLMLKRAWQAPELDAFLKQATTLPHLPTTYDVVRALERSAASTVGAPATIGLWDEERNVLRFIPTNPPAEVVEVRPGELAGGRAFSSGRVEFSADPLHDHPEGAETYRRTGVGATIAAPISSGEHRVGVLCLYAPRPPFFAESDMELAGLLADQAAAVLEARALIERSAGLQAREAAARLKEDFLSAAAHDLKTPLTTVLAQAQFLEARAKRDPAAGADIAGLERLARAAERLGTLVTDILDAARLEQKHLVGEREPTDLGAVVATIAARYDDAATRIQVDVRCPVVASVDRRRIEQLLDNLVENATKYSTDHTPVAIELWQDGETARIAVRDQGIGIPAVDLPHIFDRFSRGSNVDDRRFHGMGLGLYICRGIAEEHGGRIWAESAVGEGSTFHVALPLSGEGRPN